MEIAGWERQPALSHCCDVQQRAPGAVNGLWARPGSSSTLGCRMGGPGGEDGCPGDTNCSRPGSSSTAGCRTGVATCRGCVPKDTTAVVPRCPIPWVLWPPPRARPWHGCPVLGAGCLERANVAGPGGEANRWCNGAALLHKNHSQCLSGLCSASGGGGDLAMAGKEQILPKLTENGFFGRCLAVLLSPPAR